MNPADADDALLNRDPSMGWPFGLIPMVFTLVGYLVRSKTAPQATAGAVA